MTVMCLLAVLSFVILCVFYVSFCQCAFLSKISQNRSDVRLCVRIFQKRTVMSRNALKLALWGSGTAAIPPTPRRRIPQIHAVSIHPSPFHGPSIDVIRSRQMPRGGVPFWGRNVSKMCFWCWDNRTRTWLTCPKTHLDWDIYTPKIEEECQFDPEAS